MLRKLHEFDKGVNLNRSLITVVTLIKKASPKKIGFATLVGNCVEFPISLKSDFNRFPECDECGMECSIANKDFVESVFGVIKSCGQKDFYLN